MKPLPIAQQIKIIKNASLKIPVYRATTECYDPEKPSLFDKHIECESVKVNVTINHLLGIITFLSKELLLSNTVMPQDTWKKLTQVRDLIRDQQSVIRR